MDSGEEIIGATVHEFHSEVLVELLSRDENEDLVVYSYACSYESEDTVDPKEPVPPGHRETVTSALTERGYELRAGSRA